MTKRQPPPRDFAPIAARYRVCYRKTGRMRYASARDFQRALERAIRRGGVPVAFSAGFSPHPRISYTNPVATGVASDAEYLELALTQEVSVERLAQVLASGLPSGFEVVDVVPAATGDFADRLQASAWEIALPSVAPDTARAAVQRFMALAHAPVERLTKRGRASVDVRSAITYADVADDGLAVVGAEPCAILQVVVRHVTPSVRPVDVLAALQRAAELPPSQAPRICRRAQGPLSADGRTISDPMEPDRRAASRA